MNQFAKNLSILIEEHNITQTELAKFLGVGQQTVSKYINKRIEPSLDTVIKLAKFFDTPIATLLGAEK